MSKTTKLCLLGMGLAIIAGMISAWFAPDPVDSAGHRISDMTLVFAIPVGIISTIALGMSTQEYEDDE